MFQLPDTFEVERPAPQIIDEAALKEQFGIELANKTPFEAACTICGKDTPRALWMLQNWLNDPIVIASRDKFKENEKASITLLDKDQLAAMLLTMAREKDRNNTHYLLDGKDRIKTLELYAEIKGYKNNKVEAPATFINNHMVIKLVEPKQEIKQIDHSPTEINNTNSPVKLKLVG